MTKEEILTKITTLKDVQNKIQIEIEELQKELENYEDKTDVVPCLNTNDPQSGYYLYLTNTKKLSNHTADNYFGYLRGIKKRLFKYSNYSFEREIYNICDKNILLNIKNEMALCDQLQKDNKTQHNAFSAAFNNYVTYIFKFFNENSEEELPSEFLFDD